MSDPVVVLKGAAKVLGPLVAAKYREHKRAQLEEACETLVGELLHARSEQDVDRIIADVAPAAFDLLEEYFQTWAQALDPAARPYAARLVAFYLGEGRARDRWFRRTAELLRSVDAPELGMLITLCHEAKKLLAVATTRYPTMTPERTAVVVRDDGGASHSILVLEIGEEERHQLAGEQLSGSVESVRRLLEDHRLAAVVGTVNPQLSKARFQGESMSSLQLLIRLFAA